MRMKTILAQKAVVLVLCILVCCIPGVACAHCDTFDGPVVTAAKNALERRDITPVLKWVRKEDEKEIKELFDKTLALRKQSKEAKEIADRYFFETLVRIHRAGEGAPYAGLKREPAEPVIVAADKALESGSPDNLMNIVNGAVVKGIRERFEKTKEAKKHAEESVEAGREFVEAYVEFTHYIERLHSDALSRSGQSKAEGMRSMEHDHH